MMMIMLKLVDCQITGKLVIKEERKIKQQLLLGFNRDVKQSILKHLLLKHETKKKTQHLMLANVMNKKSTSINKNN